VQIKKMKLLIDSRLSAHTVCLCMHIDVDVDMCALHKKDRRMLKGHIDTELHSYLGCN